MTGSLNSTIVFVGHNATQTGAPKSLLKIISWFVESTDFKIIVIYFIKFINHFTKLVLHQKRKYNIHQFLRINLF